MALAEHFKTSITQPFIHYIKKYVQVESFCTTQNHFREVPRWEIFMDKKLRFGLDLGRLALLKKKRFGAIMSNFLGRFFSSFHGKKNN